MMDLEPNRESRMDERALAILQTTDLLQTINIRSHDEEGQGEENLPDSGQSSSLVQDGDSRDPLGTQSETSVGTSLEEASQAQVVLPLQLLLQLPIVELGRLHVDVDTPPFDDLGRATKRAVIASMDRQEVMHLGGETRQSANHIMACALAVLAEGRFSVHQIQAGVRGAASIRDRLLAGSVELVDLFPNGEVRDMHDNVMHIELFAQRERRVERLNSSRLMPSGDQLEKRLNDFSAHVDRLAANASEASEATQFEFVPYSMTVVPFSDDGYYRRVPGRRQSTYGRYRSFLLRDIP